MNICHVVMMVVTIYMKFPTRRTCNGRCKRNAISRKKCKRKKMKIEKKGYAFRVHVTFFFLVVCDWEEWNEIKSNFKSIAINQQFLFNLCKYVKDIPT